MQELCLMPIKIETNFEGKLMRAFKNGMRNLANFHQSTFESLKIGTLMRSFYLKCYDNEVYHDMTIIQNLKRIVLSVQN